MLRNISNPEVYGLVETHLALWAGHWVHKKIITDLQNLSDAATRNGFELGIASSFRSFDRQLAIWNAKASGRRPVLDDFEVPIDLAELSAGEQVTKILRWSALPGASRHHWGTDFDVFDAGALNASGHKLQLTISETLPGGPFAEFYMWLDDFLSDQSSPFFRPYDCDRGGVACEPWHLSHISTARQMQAQFSLPDLKEVLRFSDIMLLDTIMENLDGIYQRFIHVPLPDASES